jgi:DnaA family protein
MRQLPLGVRLRDRASFDSYYAGDNVAALAHLQALAAGGRSGCSWLYGQPGSGRTHLLQAVCAQAALTGAAAYLPLAQLLAMGPESLAGWQDAACVCVDDVDAVIGQLAWEQALFGLYREAEERGAALLFSALLPPQSLRFALPDLASRCSAGSIHGLQSLTEEQQRAALQLRARLRGLELPEETVLYVQRRWPRDMNSLFGLLDTLDEEALTAQRRLTVPFIRAVLAQRSA